MRNLLFALTTLVTITFFQACNTGSEKDNSETPANAESTESSLGADGQAQLPVLPVQKQVGDTVSSGTQPLLAINWDKKIIKTGNLTLEAKSLKSYSEALQPLLAKNGAYIAKEESRQGEGYHSSNWVIKVPALQFQDLMVALSMKDATVTERSIASDDVTTAWFDTRARLEAKRAMRNKYAEFLGKAKNMEEALQVQQEVNRIQEEIESATGRLTALTNQSAYSTINLSATEKGSGFSPAGETPGVFRRLVAAFKTGADGFAYLLIGLVSVWPLLLVIFAAVYFFRTKNLKRLPAKH